MIENASIRAIEAELGRLGEEAAEPGQHSVNRTRVLTHMAWVPPEWEAAARAVLDNLGERHPSRTIILLPDAASARDALDADVDLRCFAYAGHERSVCSEVVAIWLRGKTARAPASIAQPLLVADVPTFLRWRGALPFGEPELEQLVGVADRLIVDSTEWPGATEAFEALPSLFEQAVVSDLAWARIEPWRRAVAAMWPDVATPALLRARAPLAEALLLARWLETRLGRPVELEHEPADATDLVEIDGRAAVPDRSEPVSPSALLSAQLEIHGRDPVFEAAVRALT